MQRRMPERESAARRPPHSKNPQDYLKAILAKEPDRVKGIRAARLLRYMSREKELEARGGIEPPIMVLQTIALPLGDRATEPKEIWNGEGRGEGGPRRPVPCWSKNFRR